MKILAILDLIITKLTTAVSFAAGLCILATALIVCYEVFMRAAFNAPTEWSIEVSVYLVLISAFLGLAVTYAEGKHIKVDILTEKLPPVLRRYCEIGAVLAGIIFSVVFFIESWDMAVTSFELGRTSPSTLRVPLYLPQLSLPLGSLLLLLQMIRHLTVLLFGLKTDGRPNEETGGMA